MQLSVSSRKRERPSEAMKEAPALAIADFQPSFQLSSPLSLSLSLSLPQQRFTKTHKPRDRHTTLSSKLQTQADRRLFLHWLTDTPSMSISQNK
jgi:hypothetical protein